MITEGLSQSRRCLRLTPADRCEIGVEVWALGVGTNPDSDLSDFVQLVACFRAKLEVPQSCVFATFCSTKPRQKIVTFSTSVQRESVIAVVDRVISGR